MRLVCQVPKKVSAYSTLASAHIKTDAANGLCEGEQRQEADFKFCMDSNTMGVVLTAIELFNSHGQRALMV